MKHERQMTVRTREGTIYSAPFIPIVASTTPMWMAPAKEGPSKIRTVLCRVILVYIHGFQ